MPTRSVCWVLVSCILAGPAWAQAAPDSSAFDAAGWLRWALVWIALAAGLCAVLFKLFTLWPGAERRLAGATLIAMPLVSTVLTTAHLPYVGYLLPRSGAPIPYFAIFAFWLLVALAFGMAWQAIKARTHWLAPAPDPLAASSTSRPIAPDVAAPKARAVDAKPAAAESIFISYRRLDSADVTGRIYDRLLQRFDRRQVFKDVDSIPLGVDFRTHLGDVVGRCSVLLAVIGPQWLATTGPNGRRLDDSADFVRIELEAALSRNIPVIPVLVGGADLPAERDLPPSLAPITFRNGIAVRPDPDFHRDMDRLIAGLESHHLG